MNRCLHSHRSLCAFLQLLCAAAAPSVGRPCWQPSLEARSSGLLPTVVCSLLVDGPTSLIQCTANSCTCSSRQQRQGVQYIKWLEHETAHQMLPYDHMLTVWILCWCRQLLPLYTCKCSQYCCAEGAHAVACSTRKAQSEERCAALVYLITPAKSEQSCSHCTIQRMPLHRHLLGVFPGAFVARRAAVAHPGPIPACKNTNLHIQ